MSMELLWGIGEERKEALLFTFIFPFPSHSDLYYHHGKDEKGGKIRKRGETTFKLCI